MYRPRLIPCLLMDGGRLVKTRAFAKPAYVGDPVNTVKIFNEKEVDEIILLDIGASRAGQAPDFERVRDIATECFMPLCYGGGVRSVEDAQRLFENGVEKVAVNTAALANPGLIGEIAKRYGSQSVVAAMDVVSPWLRGHRVRNVAGRSTTAMRPVDWARRMVDEGAGELLVSAVERDGSMQGYDLELVQGVCRAVQVPVIACGGAASLDDCRRVIQEGRASAAAAGALFVYQGPHRAVLINYPSPEQLQEMFR